MRTLLCGIAILAFSSPALAQESTRANDSARELGSLLFGVLPAKIEAQNHMANGRWAEAEASLGGVLRSLYGMPKPNAELILSTRILVAAVQSRQNRATEGIEGLKAAISDAYQASPRPFEKITDAELNLVGMYIEGNNFKDAEPLLLKLIKNPETRGKHHVEAQANAAAQYSRILASRGERESARTLLQDNIKIVRELKSQDAKTALVSCLNMLALMYTEELKLEESNAILNQTFAAVDNSARASATKLSIALQISGNLVNLGRRKDALDLLLRTASELPKMGGRIKIGGIITKESSILDIEIARLYINQRNLIESKRLLLNVITSWPKIGQPNDQILVTARMMLADVYLLEKNYSGSEQEWSTVMQQAIASGGNDALRLLAKERIGLNKALAGRAVEGEKMIVEVRRSQLAMTPRSEGNLLVSAIDLAQARFMLPVSADSLTPAREAMTLWTNNLQTFDKQRTGSDVFAGESDPAAMSPESNREIFETFAEAAWRASRARPRTANPLASETLFALQKASASLASRAVVQSTLRSLADNRSAGLGASVRERQELAGSLAAIDASLAQAKLAKSPKVSPISSVEAQRAAIARRSSELDGSIRQAFPDFEQFARERPLDLKSIQGILGEGEALLFVVPTRFGTQALAVTRTGLAWHRSELTDERVGAAVRRLLWDCGAEVGVDAQTANRWEAEGGGGYAFDRKTAFSLYQELVAPVAKTLAGQAKLYVVATGSLSALPLGILVTQQPQGRDGDPNALRGTAWLADAFVISAVPTIQTLQLLKGRAGSQPVGSGITGTSFAGFGDPVLGTQGIARGTRRGLRQSVTVRAAGSRGKKKDSGVAGRVRTLASLPGTATELEGMRVALAASADALHLRERNTETAVKDTDLANVKVLAFATHGLMAGELYSGAEAGLVFTPPGKSSDRDDGYLTASEITALRINTDWVILSACNTASGDGTQGAPGLSGLARSFFYAGARNLLVSHWPVRDDVAEKITVEAIRMRQAKPGLSRSGALQLAMRKVRNDPSHDSPDDTWAHPNAWAPFSLIGEGG